MLNQSQMLLSFLIAWERVKKEFKDIDEESYFLMCFYFFEIALDGKNDLAKEEIKRGQEFFSRLSNYFFAEKAFLAIDATTGAFQRHGFNREASLAYLKTHRLSSNEETGLDIDGPIVEKWILRYYCHNIMGDFYERCNVLHPGVGFCIRLLLFLRNLHAALAYGDYADRYEGSKAEILLMALEVFRIWDARIDSVREEGIYSFLCKYCEDSGAIDENDIKLALSASQLSDNRRIETIRKIRNGEIQPDTGIFPPEGSGDANSLFRDESPEANLLRFLMNEVFSIVVLCEIPDTESMTNFNFSGFEYDFFPFLDCAMEIYKWNAFKPKEKDEYYLATNDALEKWRKSIGESPDKEDLGKLLVYSCEGNVVAEEEFIASLSKQDGAERMETKIRNTIQDLSDLDNQPEVLRKINQMADEISEWVHYNYVHEGTGHIKDNGEIEFSKESLHRLEKENAKNGSDFELTAGFWRDVGLFVNRDDITRDAFRCYALSSVFELGFIRNPLFFFESPKSALQKVADISDKAFLLLTGQDRIDSYSQKGTLDLYPGQILNGTSKVLADLFEELSFGDASKNNDTKAIPESIRQALRVKAHTISYLLTVILDDVEFAHEWRALSSAADWSNARNLCDLYAAESKEDHFSLPLNDYGGTIPKCHLMTRLTSGCFSMPEVQMRLADEEGSWISKMDYKGPESILLLNKKQVQRFNNSFELFYDLSKNILLNSVFLNRKEAMHNLLDGISSSQDLYLKIDILTDIEVSLVMENWFGTRFFNPIYKSNTYFEEKYSVFRQGTDEIPACVSDMKKWCSENIVPGFIPRLHHDDSYYFRHREDFIPVFHFDEWMIPNA